MTARRLLTDVGLALLLAAPTLALSRPTPVPEKPASGFDLAWAAGTAARDARRLG